MRLNNKTKHNKSNHPSTNKRKEKHQLRKQSINTTYNKFNQILKSKLFDQYSCHYYIKHLTQNDFLGLRKIILPTYFDLYRANELVLNKKTHYNAIYKEKMLNIYLNEVLIQFYSNRDIDIILKRLLFTTKTHAPNLLPADSLISQIIKKHQDSLGDIIEQQYQSPIIRKVEYKKEHLVVFSALDHIANRKKRQLIEKEGFHLSNFSLSISIGDTPKNKRRLSCVYRREILPKEIVKQALLDREEKEIHEIEAFVNKIAFIEENSLSKALSKSKINKKNTNESKGNANDTIEHNKSIKEKLLITTIDPICNHKNSLNSNEEIDLNNRLMLKPSLFKFKTLEEFIEKEKQMANKKNAQTVIVQNLINQYHQLENHRTRSVSITLNTAGHSTNLFCLQTPYQKNRNLAMKTSRIIKSIEQGSFGMNTSMKRLNIQKRIQYPRLNYRCISKS